MWSDYKDKVEITARGIANEIVDMKLAGIDLRVEKAINKSAKSIIEAAIEKAVKDFEKKSKEKDSPASKDKSGGGGEK